MSSVVLFTCFSGIGALGQAWDVGMLGVYQGVADAILVFRVRLLWVLGKMSESIKNKSWTYHSSPQAARSHWIHTSWVVACDVVWLGLWTVSGLGCRRKEGGCQLGVTETLSKRQLYRSTMCSLIYFLFSQVNIVLEIWPALTVHSCQMQSSVHF